MLIIIIILIEIIIIIKKTIMLNLIFLNLTKILICQQINRIMNFLIIKKILKLINKKNKLIKSKIINLFFLLIILPVLYIYYQIWFYNRNCINISYYSKANN